MDKYFLISLLGITVTALIGFIVIWELTRKLRFHNKLTSAIKESENGKTIPHETFVKKWKAETRYFKAHPIQKFFNDVFWTIRRFVIELPELPRYGYRKIKRGVQRAYRGWADEDTWNLEHYLSKVLVGSLTRLFKDRKTFRTDFTGNDDKDWNVAKSREIKRDILYAVKINLAISEGEREIYSDKWTPKLRRKFKALTKVEEARRIKGMALLHKYWFSLWD